jgi:hypothetical protein
MHLAVKIESEQKNSKDWNDIMRLFNCPQLAKTHDELIIDSRLKYQAVTLWAFLFQKLKNY